MPFLIVLIAFLGFIALAYFFFLFFDGKTLRKYFKINLVLFPIGLLLAIIMWYIYERSTPASFKEAVRYVTDKPDLMGKVGTYESYSYRSDELPKDTDNPALVRMTIRGSRAIMYLSCALIKQPNDEWLMKSIKVDSLITRTDNRY